jgi:hypothetical protein
MALKSDQEFEIQVQLAGNKEMIKVLHIDETFELEVDGQKISILNNGDNSWSLVDGELDQETVNLIGEGIENHYNSMKL